MLFTAAAAQDASTVFFNPAGMAQQSGSQLQIVAHYIIPQTEFKNQGSTSVLTTPLAGCNGGDGGEAALVTNLFYMHSFSEQWKAGIGITAPYGLATRKKNGASLAKTPGGAINFTILRSRATLWASPS